MNEKEYDIGSYALKNKILLNVYLSNPSFSSTSMFECFGIDYNNTLKQT